MGESIFSDHVRDLLAGEFDKTESVLMHLRRVVRRRLRKIRQWDLSPRNLGYDGDSWDNSDAFDDLVQDIYLCCILNQLANLAFQVEDTGACEGSVRKKITWFLSDRQKKANPVARRVYRNVRTVSKELVENGKAWSPSGLTISANSAILGDGRHSPEQPDSIRGFFAPYLEDSDFLASVSRESQESWKLLQKVIGNFFAGGMSGYRVGELATLVTQHCNRPAIVSLDAPGYGGEEQTILDLLEETRTPSAQQRYQAIEDFELLFENLRNHAEITINSSRRRKRVLEMLSTIRDLIKSGEEVSEFSTRKLAAKLGVSKSTLAEDFALLRTYEDTQGD